MMLPAKLVDRPPKTSEETARKRAFMHGQFLELRRQGQGADGPSDGIVQVTCPCGRRLALYRSYKCAECGVYLCRACAIRHFALDQAPPAWGGEPQFWDGEADVKEVPA